MRQRRVQAMVSAALATQIIHTTPLTGLLVQATVAAPVHVQTVRHSQLKVAQSTGFVTDKMAELIVHNVSRLAVPRRVAVLLLVVRIPADHSLISAPVVLLPGAIPAALTAVSTGHVAALLAWQIINRMRR